MKELHRLTSGKHSVSLVWTNDWANRMGLLAFSYKQEEQSSTLPKNRNQMNVIFSLSYLDSAMEAFNSNEYQEQPTWRSIKRKLELDCMSCFGWTAIFTLLKSFMTLWRWKVIEYNVLIESWWRFYSLKEKKMNCFLLCKWQ